MPYVFASLSDLGRLPSNCSQSPRATVFGKIQEALKGKGIDIGRYGVDCKYGESTNKALGQWIAREPPAATAVKYLERLGLSSAEAQEAAQKIATWLAANPTQPSPMARPGTPTPAGTQAGAGTGVTGGGIRMTPGSGVVPRDTVAFPSKPPGTGAGAGTGMPAADQQVVPEAPAADTPMDAPWYLTYRWYLVGGAAVLALGTLAIVLARRK